MRMSPWLGCLVSWPCRAAGVKSIPHAAAKRAWPAHEYHAVQLMRRVTQQRAGGRGAGEGLASMVCGILQSTAHGMWQVHRTWHAAVHSAWHAAGAAYMVDGSPQRMACGRCIAHSRWQSTAHGMRQVHRAWQVAVHSAWRAVVSSAWQVAASNAWRAAIAMAHSTQQCCLQHAWFVTCGMVHSASRQP
eukprot:353849-Chlamydomonas_euryale.AAC.7